jgi:uncharacterized protein (TIGR03000 family)
MGYARLAGGFRLGGYRYGFVGGYHYRPYHWGGYHGWHHPYYGWGAYYPNYGGYSSYYPNSYNTDPSYGYNPYDSSYPSSGSLTDPGATGFYPSGYSAFPAPSDSRALVTVIVPASAKVWFDGTATVSTGPVRQYSTPPLTPGRQYTYWARARWNENGREMNQLQPIDVTAGGHFHVRFPAPPSTGG